MSDQHPKKFSGHAPSRHRRRKPDNRTIARNVAALIGTTDPDGAIEELMCASPTAIPADPADQFRAFVARMLLPEPYYNLTVTAQDSGRPVSPGVTLTGSQYQETAVIEELVGNWYGGLIRINPVIETGPVTRGPIVRHAPNEACGDTEEGSW